MEARAREVERIFDLTITYCVPLYQRPYVWKVDLHWEPLWEDVQNLLDRHLAWVVKWIFRAHLNPRRTGSRHASEPAA